MKQILLKKTINVFCFALLFGSAMALAQNTIYVNANVGTAGNGSSWRTAFKDLQPALDAAGSNDQIWVAAGTYYPTEAVDGSDATNNRHKNFHATGKNIKIYGGFVGNEQTLVDRKLTAANETIFSGDLGVVDNDTDNAYHVFLLSSVEQSLFNGVTITGANINEEFSYSYGGNTFGSVSGGGICSRSENFSSSVTVENSKITNNSFVILSSGGGIYSFSKGSSAVTVTNNSTVANNKTKYDGGGIYSESTSSSSTVTVTNSMVANNEVEHDNFSGGGIFSKSKTTSPNYTIGASTSTVAVVNSTIKGNSTGKDGGGIFSESIDASTVTLENSTLADNSTSNLFSGTQRSGGGVYSYSYKISKITVKNSTVVGNKAARRGGGLCSSAGVYAFENPSVTSTVTVENSTVANNIVQSDSQSDHFFYNKGNGIYSRSNSVSSFVIIKGSIVHNGNGERENNIYNRNYTAETDNFVGSITSQGYNIFNDAPPGYNDAAKDKINVTAAVLNLQPLADNGGSTQTMLPGTGSIAINNGDPMDTTAAQNGAIVDTRDIGAADAHTATLGIENLEQTTTQMLVYPNPAVDELHIKAAFTTQAQLITVGGQVIQTFTLQTNKPIILNISNLPQGIYFLKTNNGQFTKKIMVRR